MVPVGGAAALDSAGRLADRPRPVAIGARGQPRGPPRGGLHHRRGPVARTEGGRLAGARHAASRARPGTSSPAGLRPAVQQRSLFVRQSARPSSVGRAVTSSTVSSEMNSPAHRAALGFLRGGLIAALCLALAPVLGAALGGRLPVEGWPVKDRRSSSSRRAAFVLAGEAIGGEAMGSDRAARLAFGCGAGAAGLLLLLAFSAPPGADQLRDPLVVVPYATATSALAFGAMGLIGQPGRPARQGRPGCGRLRRWRHRPAA